MKRIQLPPLSASLCAAAALALLAQPAVAATLNYTNDFSGSSGNGDLPSETGAASYTVSGGVYTSNQTTTGGVASGATINLTNADDRSFTMETRFRISSFPTNGAANTNNTMGFSLFGNVAGNTSGNYYYASLRYSSATGTASGELKIEGLGTAVAGGANELSNIVSGNADDNASNTLALTQNTWYRLRLDAVYNSGMGALAFTLGLYSDANIQIGTSATATLSAANALAGQQFGLRQRTNFSGGTNTIQYDDFSVVPEPGMMAYSIFGLGAMLLVRRRRRA